MQVHATAAGDAAEVQAHTPVACTRGERLNLYQQRRLLAAARAIVQFPRPPLRLQRLSHRPQRRDPDAAGDQNAGRRVRDQGEVVARRADPERVASAYSLVQETRAAPALLLQGHCDAIAVGLVWRVNSEYWRTPASPTATSIWLPASKVGSRPPSARRRSSKRTPEVRSSTAWTRSSISNPLACINNVPCPRRLQHPCA